MSCLPTPPSGIDPLNLAGDENLRTDGANWMLAALRLSQDSKLVAPDGAWTWTLPAASGKLFLLSIYQAREEPSGDIDGTNVTFGLAARVESGTEQVFLNGLLLDDDHYSITNLAAAATLTLVDAPQPGDRLRITYLKG